MSEEFFRIVGQPDVIRAVEAVTDMLVTVYTRAVSRGVPEERAWGLTIMLIGKAWSTLESVAKEAMKADKKE